MANYSNLKAAIAAAIKTNGNQEITGQVLQDVLTSIVSVIGANYTFAGVATPATNPGTPDQNVFYFATQLGTYSNFGGISTTERSLFVFLWNGTWTNIDLLNLDDYYQDLDTLVAQFEQQLRQMLEDYQPIVIEGNITNAPDEEDLTSVDNLLRLKNRNTLYGMGCIYLRRELGFAEQLTQENTIYVIRYDYTLTADVTIPANCMLQFEGGSISGGFTITGQGTGIQAGLVKIFHTDVTLAGTWNVAEVYPEWFGAVGDGVADDSTAINKLNSFRCNIADSATVTIKLAGNKVYGAASTVVLEEIDMDMNAACIKAIASMEVLLSVHGITPPEQFDNHYWIAKVYNGRIDGNGLATKCVVSDELCLYMNNCKIVNPVEIGIQHLGNTFGFQRVNKCCIKMDRLFTKRHMTREVITKAIYVTKGDCTYDDIEICDFNYGVYETKASNNLYLNVRVWAYAETLKETCWGHLKYYSQIINPTIDTIAAGFELEDQANYNIIGLTAMCNTGVWRLQIAEGSADDKFYLFKNATGKGTFSVNIIGAYITTMAPEYHTYDNSILNVYLFGVNNYNAHSEKEYNISDTNSYLLRRTPSTRDADILLDEGNYMIWSLTNWSHIPNALKVSGYGAHLYVKRADAHVWQYIILQDAISGQNRKPTMYFRTGVVTNNGTIFNGWVYNRQVVENNKLSGTTSERPTGGMETGYMYFDTTLNKPIYWNGTAWVDATGNPV